MPTNYSQPKEQSYKIDNDICICKNKSETAFKINTIVINDCTKFEYWHVKPFLEHEGCSCVEMRPKYKVTPIILCGCHV